MSISHVRCTTSVSTCCTHPRSVLQVGIDVDSGRQRHHEILDLGRRRIQFHRAGRRNR